MYAIVLTLLIVTVYQVYGLNSSSPLYLTPFLQEGNIHTARNLSLVVDPSGVIPKSYAGFITVDRRIGNHLFFWFFPALNSDPKSPLVVWLNGGPGVSSMLGLFYENGPLKLIVRKNSTATYRRRRQSWADTFSMLYIDNPVGVGYSHSDKGVDGFRTSQEGYTEDIYEFIQQFYTMFPEYHDRELYIGGQSYAGKYVTAFAYQIHQEIKANRTSIPLKGIYLGGPYFDPETQSYAHLDLYYSMGYISHKQLVEFKEKVTVLLKVKPICNGDLENYFKKLLPGIYFNLGENIFTLEEVPYLALHQIMSSQSIRLATHVGNVYYDLFSEMRGKLCDDFIISNKAKLATLMDNYKVLLFTGDLDSKITSPMVEAALMSTPWSLQSVYNNSARKIWTMNNVIRGFYSHVGQFCRVTIRAAGHQVPYDQPEGTVAMMSSFVRQGCIGNGTDKPYSRRANSVMGYMLSKQLICVLVLLNILTFIIQ